MKIRFDHINMTVNDLKESVAWYASVFGMKLVEAGTNGHGPWAIVALEDTMVCMSEHPDWRGADRQRDGQHQIYHFGVRVSDEKAWVRKLKELGLKVQYGGAYDYPGSRSWYILDPTGHEIEVSYSGNRPLEFPAGE